MTVVRGRLALTCWGAASTHTVVFGASFFARYDGNDVMDTSAWRLAVVEDWRALEHAPASVRADRDLVRGTLEQSWGWSIQHAAEALRNDSGLCLQAVQQDGLTLQFVSDSLLADSDFVIQAVRRNGWALEYASETVRAHRDVVIAAAKQSCGQALDYASPTLLLDRTFWFDAVAQLPKGWRILEHLPAELRSDKTVLMEAVRKDWRALQFASSELNGDRELVRCAILQNWEALTYAAEELQDDHDLLHSTIKPHQAIGSWSGTQR